MDENAAVRMPPSVTQAPTCRAWLGARRYNPARYRSTRAWRRRVSVYAGAGADHPRTSRFTVACGVVG